MIDTTTTTGTGAGQWSPADTLPAICARAVARLVKRDTLRDGADARGRTLPGYSTPASGPRWDRSRGEWRGEWRTGRGVNESTRDDMRQAAATGCISCERDTTTGERIPGRLTGGAMRLLPLADTLTGRPAPCLPLVRAGWERLAYCAARESAWQWLSLEATQGLRGRRTEISDTLRAGFVRFDAPDADAELSALAVALHPAGDAPRPLLSALAVARWLRDALPGSRLARQRAVLTLLLTGSPLEDAARRAGFSSGESAADCLRKSGTWSTLANVAGLLPDAGHSAPARDIAAARAALPGATRDARALLPLASVPEAAAPLASALSRLESARGSLRRAIARRARVIAGRRAAFRDAAGWLRNASRPSRAGLPRGA